MTVKHYKPGDPEFDKIAKQITPIHKVRETSRPKPLINAEMEARRPRYGRNEDRDKFRG